MNAKLLIRSIAAAGLIIILISSCAPQQRMGMVLDNNTGLQFGSVVENNFLIDSSQFENKKIKLRIRNTSGDQEFDLRRFKSAIEQSYMSKGYEPSNADDFGILIDVNVVYSGQISTNLSTEFAFLGAAAGGIIGARSNAEAGTAIGLVSGITLGAILGTFVTDDTYIVVADVNVAVTDLSRTERKTTIIFGADDKEEERASSGFKPFRERLQTGISVYAGGRSISQSRIAEQVRQRLVRILADVI
jgi:hypothetical protein